MRARRYYYIFVHSECPVCGRDHSYKYREYGKKPKEAQKLHRYEEHYDWCDVGVYG